MILSPLAQDGFALPSKRSAHSFNKGKQGECVEFPIFSPDFLSLWLHLLRTVSPGLAWEHTAPLDEKS